MGVSFSGLGAVSGSLSLEDTVSFSVVLFDMQETAVMHKRTARNRERIFFSIAMYC